MKRNTLFALLIVGTSTFFVSCSSKETPKLDELLKRKSELRKELAAIQEQINVIEANKSTSSIPLVTLGKLEEKAFSHKISVQGNVETDHDAIINAELGGLISSINVKEGDRVEKGQLLITIDAAMINASIKEVQTQMDYANYLLKKQEELKNRGIGSEFDYKGALNQVNSLKSKLNTLELQRSKANIVAPFSGVIDQIFAKQGQMASPQGQVLRIVNTNSITITADLSEKHMKNINVGTVIKVSFPNFRDTTISVKIASVAKYIDPTNRTFRITAVVNNNKILVPNMLAELEITDIHEEKALVIPSVSILKDYNNNDYIFAAYKSKENGYSLIKVLIKEIEKFKGSSMIELKDDLKIGSNVVVKGVKGITESDVVRIN
jgi:membrane fusion protein, multidrug efflux system